MAGEPTVLRRLLHGPAPGPRNMAVDEALMAAAAAGAVVLRFYRWDPACVSLGRNQAARGRWDRGAAARRGVDFVRRPSGGRAVLHDRELTYAVAAPADLWGGLRASYRRVNRALLRGLVALGAAAEAAPDGGRTPGPSDRACFRDPLPGEITARGRKLVGSAQWRNGGALLQHGSLLLHDDQAVMGELRGPSPGDDARASPGDPADEAGAAARDGREKSGACAAPAAPSGAAASLSELVPELPGPRRLARALARGFSEEFGLAVEPGELSAGEVERVGEAEARYRSEDWTWRR